MITPPVTPAGSWTIHQDAGNPSAVEFHEGRLGVGGTLLQPTGFWLSRSNDYENFFTGVLADDGLAFVIASRQVNLIRWMASFDKLVIGDSNGEHAAIGPGNNEPLGGDVTPNVKSQGIVGSKSVQPLVVSDGVLFIQRAGRKVYVMRPDPNILDKLKPVEITPLAEHITSPGLSQHMPAYAAEPYKQIFFIRSDGILIVCTYDPDQEVTAFARYTTDGTIESVAVVPHPDGDRDRIWVIVNRTLDGATKRYLEYFDDKAPEFTARNWPELFTDCALVYDGSATTTITGLTHLEAKTVDVMADGCYKGTKVVASGQITLTEAASKVEVGLHYIPIIKTMRPAFPEDNIEGLTRSWQTLFVRLLNSIGLEVNGEEALFNIGGQQMDSGPALFTGDKEVKIEGSDKDGYITLKQIQPYPLTVLAVFGDIEIGDAL